MSIEFDREKYPFVAMGFDYAEDILSGKIPSNIWIKGACNRFHNDLKRSENVLVDFFFDFDAAEKYLRIVQKFHHAVGHWDPPNIVYEPWQCFLWMNVKGWLLKSTKTVRFRSIHGDIARGNAKALSLDTEIPTPEGFRRFGDMSVGDALFDRNGDVCYITGETEVHRPKSYKIKFDRDKVVYASDKHLWFTFDRNARSRLSRHRRNPLAKEVLGRKYVYNSDYEKIKTTSDLEKDFLFGNSKKESRYSVMKADPIDCKTYSPKIDMYFLGYWLGNGSKRCGRVTSDSKDSSELVSIFKKRGLLTSPIVTKKESNGVTFTVYGQKVILDNLNLTFNKRIPSWVWSCSLEDRRDLICGLLDSDGSIAKGKNDGRVEFSTVDENFAKDVSSLISSIGFKNRWNRYFIDSNFHTENIYYYALSFTPVGDVDFFKLKRKLDRQVRKKRSFTQSEMFYISDISEVDPMDMKCIEVDSPDNSFLITRDFIPTHNSTMASQATLFDVCCDNPNGNRIYCAATSRMQAGEVLEGAQIMARKNPSYIKRFGVEVMSKEIIHRESNSFVKSISAQANNADGKIGKTIITDELHAMQRKLYETLASGQSKRRDSQIISITTAGYKNDGIGASQRAYAKKVALGEIEDDTFFSLVYCVDDGDDCFAGPSIWIKANPNYGKSVDPINFEAQAKKAQVNPEDRAGFLIKHCNLYLDSMNQFFDKEKWVDCRNTSLTLDDFKGERCFVGIDLASTVDITSYAIVFKREDVYYVFFKNFVPEAQANLTSKQSYQRYIEEGDLVATTGNSINLPAFRLKLLEDIKDLNVEAIHCDKWNAQEMMTHLSEAGYEVVDFRMNTGNLSGPMKKLLAIMSDKQLAHNSGSMLEWCIGNVVARYDANENVFPRKEHESLKIDPIVAFIMAIAGWINEEFEDSRSVYEDRGFHSF